jgi:hypothetical protein
MSLQPGHLQNYVAQSHNLTELNLRVQQQTEPMFYYFAYGSCMCPVDLKRSLGEKTHVYVIGPATLKGYRLGFYSIRHCVNVAY